MSASNSHLMKTTKRGRPFAKDIHDLFCTLAISLPLDTHRSFFKQYPNSFTCDEAAANLSSLKFSQSNRSTDPKDPSRVITTTTTTTFSMSREMAKGICQLFMDGHLIENASDLSSAVFKDRGVYMLTPKGLHMLERFITRNGIAADTILRVFAAQSIVMKMLVLERRSGDDEIIMSRGVMDVVWRRFAGREPNITKLSEEELLAQYHSRYYAKTPNVNPGDEVNFELGMVMRKMGANATEKRVHSSDEYQFVGASAVEWLLDHSTAVAPDEAAEVCAQMVRYGLVVLVSDKGRLRDNSIIGVAKAGGAGGGAGAIMQEAEFRGTDKAIYRVTKLGMEWARWIEPAKPSSSGSGDGSGSGVGPQDAKASTATLATPKQPQLKQTNSFEDELESDAHTKDSHTARLAYILNEPAVRSLFRDFLRTVFCEENLSFWLEVQDFKRRFNTTSTAVANSAAVGVKVKNTPGHQAMERHQQELISMAFVIYNTYLAPASPCELNIDHNLRAELVSYMTSISTDKESAKTHMDPVQTSQIQASQLQNMVKLYERIQTYIFRLMATDSMPKFVKTDKFINLTRSLYDYGSQPDSEVSEMKNLFGAMNVSGRGGTPGKGDTSPTRAYLTISQAANEKQAAMYKDSSRPHF